MIDFEGNASFPPGEEPPWLPFTSELLGIPWVRLAVVGAPESVAIALGDNMQDHDRGNFVKTRLEHVDEEDFRNFARRLLRKGRKSIPEAETSEVMSSLKRLVEAVPARAMLTTAAVLAAMLLRQKVGS